nr:MAG TPA: hypothetical protein [Bacteriophage sp.]
MAGFLTKQSSSLLYKNTLLKVNILLFLPRLFYYAK